MISWLALSALAAESAAVWRLSIDGVDVGTREIRVRDADDVRIIEETTSLASAAANRPFTYAQRVTATSHAGEPSSFHSRVETNGRPVEVQARIADGVWTVTVTHDAQTRTTSPQGGAVDLSTVDLVDPLADRRLSDRDHARILSADHGTVSAGRVADLGPSQVVVGGHPVDVDGYEWQSETGARCRFWYATSGFLVR